MQLKGTEKSADQKHNPHKTGKTSWQHDGLSCLQNGLPKETWASLALDARQQSCQKSPYSSIPAFLIAKEKNHCAKTELFLGTGKKKTVLGLPGNQILSGPVVLLQQHRKANKRSSNFSTWNFQVARPQGCLRVSCLLQGQCPQAELMLQCIKL